MLCCMLTKYVYSENEYIWYRIMINKILIHYTLHVSSFVYMWCMCMASTVLTYFNVPVIASLHSTWIYHRSHYDMHVRDHVVVSLSISREIYAECITLSWYVCFLSRVIMTRYDQSLHIIIWTHSCFSRISILQSRCTRLRCPRLDCPPAC